MKKGKKMRKVFILYFLIILPIFSDEIVLKVKSGFYERKTETVKAEIDFDEGIDINSLKLIEGEKDVPFYFLLKEKKKGEIYWIIEKMEPLEEKIYYLMYRPGKSEGKIKGDEAIKNSFFKRENLVPDDSFEEGKWTLLPNPELCSIVEEGYDGKKSLRIKAEKKDDKEIKGYAISQIFPLKPKTKYKISYKLKISEVSFIGNHGAVIVEVQYLDENKNRVYPTNYAINRLMCVYSLYKEPYKTNEWVEVKNTGETLAEVRYGKIQAYFWNLHGEALIDEIVLEEITDKEPVLIEIERRKK